MLSVSCTKASVTVAVHLVETEMISHVYSSCASKDNNGGRDDINQHQDELKKAEWLAEAESVYTEGHVRHGKHLQAGYSFLFCDEPCQCTRAWCELHTHSVKLRTVCVTW